MHWGSPFLPPLPLRPSHTSIFFFASLPSLPPSAYFSASVFHRNLTFIPSSLQSVIRHSLTSSSHYCPSFLFSLRPLLVRLWPFFPLQLYSSWLFSLPFICLSNIICPLLIPSSSPFSSLPLILLYSLIRCLRAMWHGLMFTFVQ